MKVTDQEPAVMNVGPGIWIFTVDAPDQEGAYSIAAFQNADQNQNQPTVSQSSDVSLQTITYSELLPLTTATPTVTVTATPTVTVTATASPTATVTATVTPTVTVNATP